MTPSLFVSVFAYALHKVGGPEALGREIEAGESARWPGFRTLARARTLEDVALHVDGSTLITKARCRAAGAFLASPCDVWLTVDDDADAPAWVLEKAAQLVRLSQGVVLVAMPLRGKDTLNVTRSSPILHAGMHTPDGERHPYEYGTATEGGLALAAIHRSALATVAKASQAFREGERECPAVFCEYVHAGHWIGEDVAFCRTATGCKVPLAYLYTSEVRHVGPDEA